jgi:protein-S-isoprenylcysteine O-methyltransferase Ste14
MKSILSYMLAWFASLIIFLGFPLLGWGIDKIPQFFDSPARLVYIILITLLQLFGILYNPQARQTNKEGRDGIEKHKLDLVLIQILSLSVVFLAPFSDGRLIGTLNVGETVRFMGFLFVMPGFILMQMAQKHLGRQFSINVTIQKDHELIRNGPYKFIRHPRYLGILAFFMGISIVFRSLLAIVLVAVLSFVLAWRIHAEELLMQQEFGREWDVYCKKSWRIIPFVF